MESSTDYDLFFVVELGGLQYRKYIVQFPQSHCDSACGATHVARVVKFKKKNVSQWKRTGRKLLPVLNECYKLMFDQETNLLHSITDRQVLLQYVSKSPQFCSMEQLKLISGLGFTLQVQKDES